MRMPYFGAFPEKDRINTVRHHAALTFPCLWHNARLFFADAETLTRFAFASARSPLSTLKADLAVA